jgi:hypothetical protein
VERRRFPNHRLRCKPKVELAQPIHTLEARAQDAQSPKGIASLFQRFPIWVSSLTDEIAARIESKPL